MKKQLTISKETLQKILKEHELEEYSDSKELSGGFANPAFLVNKKYVVRFHAVNHNSGDRFSRESILYPLFRNKNVPAPQLVAIDLSQKLIPYHYIVITCLEGEALSSTWSSLSESSRKKLAEQTGSILKRIHSLGPKDIPGKLDLFKANEDWKETFLKEFEESYEKFNFHNNNLENEDRGEIEGVLEEFKELSNDDLETGLLHYDFHANHVMVDQGRVTGFIDFEWSRFGDPLWDLQKLPINLSIDGDFQIKDFLIGYGKEEFTEKELIRFKTYCFMQGIWQIDNTKFGNFGFPDKSMEDGYQLIRNTRQWLV